MRPTDKGPINLRGHHLLCISTFSGMGYDADFISNMEAIVGMCKSPSQYIRVIEGVDDICTSCPHSDGSRCLKDEKKASAMDRDVLVILGLEVGGIYTSSSLNLRVKDGIEKRLFTDVCARCSWFNPYCRHIIS